MDATITQEDLQQSANQLIVAMETGVPCSPIRNIIGDSDVAAAYAVQGLVNSHRISKGEKVVGAKIGLTSLAVQQQLGVNQPDFGYLFASTEVENGGKLSVREVIQPKAEAEIAFKLKFDLDGEITEESVSAAVDFAVGAIEIVGSRVLNWDIRITDTVADNASASHFVLGTVTKKIDAVDLAAVTMKLYKNGVEVSAGVGAACLGSPLKALMWLAKTYQELGTPLKAGDWVLSGALGPMVAGESGDHFEAEISDFGKVGFSFVD